MGEREQPERFGAIFVARFALVCVGSAMLANFMFNLAATYAGWPHPYSNFLFLPQDRFADFFKLAFSYPGGPINPTSELWGMDARFEAYKAAVTKYAGSKFNHFHVPPLPTLLALSWRQAMTVLDPMLLFNGLGAVGLGTLVAVVVRGAGPGASGLLVGILAVFNYPVAMMIDRGHFFSLVCAICLIAAILRSDRARHRDWLTLILYGIAINFRPHAGIFVAALFLCRWGWSAGELIRVAAIAFAIFVATLALSSMIYPAYDFTAFLHGLRDYSSLLVVGDYGLAYGSSLLAAAKALFGFSVLTFWLSLIVPALLLVGVIVAARERRVDYAELIYLVAAVYCLGTQVFADYHLMVFLAPLVLLARQGGIRRRGHWAVLLGCCFVLSPKNYFFHEYPDSPLPWSWQIIANPLFLLGTSAYILYHALRRSDPRTVEG